VLFNRGTSRFALGAIKVSATSQEGATKQNLVMEMSGLALLVKPENLGSITTAACGTETNPCPDGLTADDLHMFVIDPVNLNDGGANKIDF